MSAPGGAARLGRDYFDDLYQRNPDPWAFATSAYEHAKYEHSLAVLGDRRFSAALEVGCSIGVFTAMLGPRCERLCAVDVSAVAVEAARERCAEIASVSVARRSLPEQTPHGPFDLVVCSEVLYYFAEPLLGEVLEALSARLAPEGLLLAVHWTRPTRTYPLGGERAHELVRGHGRLRSLHGESRPDYRLDLLARR